MIIEYNSQKRYWRQKGNTFTFGHFLYSLHVYHDPHFDNILLQDRRSKSLSSRNIAFYIPYFLCWKNADILPKKLLNLDKKCRWFLEENLDAFQASEEIHRKESKEKVAAAFHHLWQISGKVFLLGLSVPTWLFPLTLVPFLITKNSFQKWNTTENTFQLVTASLSFFL